MQSQGTINGYAAIHPWMHQGRFVIRFPEPAFRYQASSCAVAPANLGRQGYALLGLLTKGARPFNDKYFPTDPRTLQSVDRLSKVFSFPDHVMQPTLGGSMIQHWQQV